MSTVLSQRPDRLDAAQMRAGDGPRLEIAPSREARAGEVLTASALDLLLHLHAKFEPRRCALLSARVARQRAFDAGELPGFLPTSADVRNGDWRIAPVPGDLRDRRVEIAGPPERKFVINALNAPVQTFLADFEDACSPTWGNLLSGQINLADAVRRRIEFSEAGRHYRLVDRPAALMVRPRGWHLGEKHVRVDGQPVSAALFDFAIYLAVNHEVLAALGSGPYFYLPKLEGHEEARLWNDVFVAAQERLGIARGTIKATVLIETVPAAFEMDEILFELREHAVGLSTGRWDYIFSFIKKFRGRPDWVLPDRAGLTMESPLLKFYEQLLIHTSHRRGTQAIGGMAAQMTIHSAPAANAAAMERVRADKLREAGAGLDGSWIAYPVLAPIARRAFDSVRAGPERAGRSGELDTAMDRAARLLRLPEGDITATGIRRNIRIGVRYLESWLSGTGNVPLYHQVEDAATAEICRAQLWQWLHHDARTAEGWVLTPDRFQALLTEELERIHDEVGSQRTLAGVFPSATRLFAGLVLDEEFEEFMTLPAYDLLS
jgi:malate synthase